MFSGLAMPTVHSHDPLPKKKFVITTDPFKAKKSRNVVLYTARTKTILGFSYLEKV